MKAAAAAASTTPTAWPTASSGARLTRRAAVPRHLRQQRRHRAPTVAAVNDRSGGAVLDRPGFGTIGPNSEPAIDSRGSKLDSGGGCGLGGGSWRVLLVDSEKHTEERVVQAILTVVPGADEPHAANCFHTARSLGMAIITSAAREHAEHFCQQLWQRGCKVSMEPDSTTI